MAKDMLMNLRLNSVHFEQNMSRSKKQMSNWRRKNEQCKKSILSWNTALKGSTAAIGGWIAGLASASAIVSSTVKKNMEFEKSLSSLRSLTGVTTEELQYFKGAAVKLGSATTQSASQVVDAFKMIGSQSPTLLKSKEALAEVTKNAIILSEAAEIELKDASKGVTTVMNQMSMSGMESARIINVLAAASQAGAGDVGYLNAALEKSASVGASFGVSFEEMVALIETLAPRISEATTAGTNLRNIFIKLETSGNNQFRPSIVGITQALINLKEANLSASEQAKLFGLENIAAGKALIDNTNEVINYQNAITGTNTALEQQKINTNNLAGSVKSLESNWEALQLAAAKSNGLLSLGVKAGENFIKGLRIALGEKVDYDNPYTVSSSYNQIKADVEAQSKAYVNSGMTKEEANKKAFEYVKQLNRMELEDLKKLQAEKDKYYNNYLNSKGSGYRIERINKQEWEAIPDKAPEIQARESAMEMYERELSAKDGSDIGNNGSQTNVVSQSPANYSQDQLEEAQRFAGLGRLKEQGKAMLDEAKVIKEKINNEFNVIGAGVELPDDINKWQEQRVKLLKEQQEAQEALNDSMYLGSELESMLFGSNTISKGLQMMALYDTLGASLQKMDALKKASADSGKAVTDQNVANNEKETASAMTAFSAQLMKWFAFAGPFAPVLAMGVSMAAMAGLGQVVGMIPKFASGGIVGGGSYSGDRIPSLLNSGEMVLNERQQTHLFNQLDRGNSGGGLSGQVEFVIKGDYLKGILNKTNKRDSRV